MKKREESKRMNVFAGKSEVKSVLIARPRILVHMYKDVYVSTNDLNHPFPSIFMSLVQKFEDPFLKEIPYGNPCIKFLKSYGKLNKRHDK